MIKFQKKFQKIIVFVTLLMCVAMFIYALGTTTTTYDSLFQAFDPDLLPEEQVAFPGAEMFYEVEAYTKTFVNYAIIMLLISLTLFFTNTHVRRKYYIGNYIATAATCLAIVAFSVWIFINNTEYYQRYAAIDFVGLKEYLEMRFKTFVEPSYVWFKVGYVLPVLFLLTAAGLIFNLILKLILMKQEEKLLDATLAAAN
jgi:hypothetical protein